MMQGIDGDTVMALHYFWWIAAAILVGVEMMTGTFYLLVVALACVAGGLVAFAGFDAGWQWGVAAVIEVIGTLAINQWKKKYAALPKLSNSLDVGQRVSVLEWRDDDTARVSYRGTQWDGVLDSPATPKREHMVIVEMRGAVLVLGPAPAPA
jgi:membrane protein implicated in regulation of membrane protease activity